MGMTIDKTISELEILKKNTFSYMSAHQAFITAIETMRKYQKIEDIYYHQSGEALENSLRAVIEDGNVN